MMKSKKTLVIAFLMMVSLIGGVFTGCGSPTVNLNDYVKITTSGYDGYGQLYASVDTDQLIEDYSDYLTDKSLDTQYFGNQTPALAADFVFSNYDPYELVYDAGENLKNGDKIEFTWNTSESAIETLKGILKVNIKFTNFTHTVADLEALVECDPFENVKMAYYGISGSASVNEYDSVVSVSAGDRAIEFDIDAADAKDLANGSTVHISLKDVETPEYYAEHYGISLTQTEADVVVKGLDYYPQDGTQEVFECITEKSYANALAAVKTNYEDYVGQMQYEFVGAVYYYNEGEKKADPDYSLFLNQHNRLVLIYRLNNGVYPNDWYTYIAPNDNVVIRQMEQEDGKTIKTTTFSKYYTNCDDDAFLEKLGNYWAEHTYLWGGPEYPTQFKYDGLRYAGHQTLEECLEAITVNLIGDKSYDHLVATDSLADYVTEY